MSDVIQFSTFALSGRRQVDTELTYSEMDPLQIVFRLSCDGVVMDWMISRDLLDEVFREGAAGLFDVKMTVVGTSLCLHLLDCDTGQYVSFRFIAERIQRFLVNTYKLVPRGAEVIDVDAMIARLLETR